MGLGPFSELFPWAKVRWWLIHTMESTAHNRVQQEGPQSTLEAPPSESIDKGGRVRRLQIPLSECSSLLQSPQRAFGRACASPSPPHCLRRPPLELQYRSLSFVTTSG
jgi:hypothetical protein